MAKVEIPICQNISVAVLPKCTFFSFTSRLYFER